MKIVTTMIEEEVYEAINENGNTLHLATVFKHGSPDDELNE